MSIPPLAASPSGFIPPNSDSAKSTPAPVGAALPGAAASTGLKPGDSAKVGTAAAAEEASGKDAQASAKELKEAVDKLNERLKPFISEAVRFNVDDESGKLIVTVVDTEKNTVIRQIPTQEALKMSRSTDIKPPGLLLNTTA